MVATSLALAVNVYQTEFLNELSLPTYSLFCFVASVVLTAVVLEVVTVVAPLILSFPGAGPALAGPTNNVRSIIDPITDPTIPRTLLNLFTPRCEKL
jgi:hypothetical protein